MNDGLNHGNLKTGYVYHELFGWHDTGTNAGFFPSDPARGLQPYLNYENPETKKRIHELIVVSGLIDHLQRIPARHATNEELLLVHPQSYLTNLKKISESRLGGDAGDGETPLAKGGYEIGTLAVGAVTALAQAVVSGEVDNGYALVRPPGHHAIRAGGMGYCLFSNLGIALSVIKRDYPDIRIATVDWDVHHGNGTQEIFYEDPNVLTISLHQDRLYPRESGDRSERGSGAGLNTNINIPLPAGTGNGGYLYAFQEVVLPALKKFKPDLIAVASGFDSSVYDPLGRMMLTANGYAQLTKMLMQSAAESANHKLMIAHEGGYNAVYSPFCGLFVLQQLSGIYKLGDPFDHTENYPGQALYDHQKSEVDESAKLLSALPDNR
jgi:acetoin utilization deacetylase AcuC-like enzyme